MARNHFAVCLPVYWHLWRSKIIHTFGLVLYRIYCNCGGRITMKYLRWHVCELVRCMLRVKIGVYIVISYARRGLHRQRFQCLPHFHSSGWNHPCTTGATGGLSYLCLSIYVSSDAVSERSNIFRCVVHLRYLVKYVVIEMCLKMLCPVVHLNRADIMLHRERNFFFVRNH